MNERHYDRGGGSEFFLAESKSRLYPHMRAKCGRDPTAASKKVDFKFISTRQHDNIQRQRPRTTFSSKLPKHNFIKTIRTCVPNLGAIRHEFFLTIYNPLNPPGVGWVKFF